MRHGALLVSILVAAGPAAAVPRTPRARRSSPTSSPADRVLDPTEIRAEKLTHVNFAFANVVGGRVVEGAPRDAENLKVLTGLRRDHPHLQDPGLGRRLELVEGVLGRGAHGEEPPRLRRERDRLREAPRPRRLRRGLGVPRAPRRRQPAPARGQGELHRAHGGAARGPRPRGHPARTAPPAHVRRGRLARVPRAHRDGQGPGARWTSST